MLAALFNTDANASRAITTWATTGVCGPALATTLSTTAITTTTGTTRPRVRTGVSD